MEQATSPQLEDGYVRIANELYDAILAFPFTGREQKVVWTILRKTYGYGKKLDDISASQIGALCGLERPHVTTTLNKLASMNVIVKRAGQFGSLIGINKNYRAWKEAGKSDVSPSTKSVQVYQIGTSGAERAGLPGESAQSLSEPSFAGNGSTDSVLVPEEYAPRTESVQVDSTDSVHTKDNLPKDIGKQPPQPPVPGGEVLETEKPKRERKPRIALRTFLDRCKADGVKPITSYASLMEYVDGIQLPGDFLALAWDVFCRAHLPGGANAARRQADWRQHFANYVEKGYYRLWVCKPDGSFELTATGQQAMQFHNRRRVA
ncbi:replication protein [Cupriavidus basilensis]|uniref:replication protein n=1 Tax=Cupriavidus basilensis TaxID=68895 RepID=UPI00157BA959|nr:hypothetical protein [Cupriavidus basilensis]